MRKYVMVYDTETTGKTDFKAAYDAPHQPNLVQLGYKVYDPISRAVIFEIGHLVNSTVLDSWTGIHPDAENVHKISQEMIEDAGWSPSDSISMFQRWANRCFVKVAHNESFDLNVMQCAAKRSGWSPDLFPGMLTFCTMQRTTNICKIPHPKGWNSFKWPSLDEGYKFFVDPKGFTDAHNALADVNACGDIFWKLVDKEIVKLYKEDGNWTLLAP